MRVRDQQQDQEAYAEQPKEEHEEVREEEFDAGWEIIEEYVREAEACFPKWFFEYDAPVDPPDTVFSGAKPLTTSGGFSGAVRLQEAYALGLAAAEILRNKTYLSPIFQAPLYLQLLYKTVYTCSYFQDFQTRLAVSGQ